MSTSSSPKNSSRKNFTNTLLGIFRFIFRYLPRWIILPVMRFFLLIGFFFMKKVKKVCLNNMKSVYKKQKSDDEYNVMVKDCIKNIGYSMVDLLYYLERPQAFEDVLTITGEEHLQKALADKIQ